MVGYNRIPTKRLRADARFPRGAGQAKRRHSQQPRGDLTLPCLTPRLTIHSTRLPLRRVHRCPLLVPSPTTKALSSCRCRSFSSPLFSRAPLTPRPTHTVRKPPRRSPFGELRLVILFPLCGRPPAVPASPPPGQGNAGSLRIQTTEHEVTTRQI